MHAVIEDCVYTTVMKNVDGLESESEFEREGGKLLV